MRTSDFEKLASERGIDLGELAEALKRVPPRTVARLSDPEQAVLRRLGIDPDERSDVPVQAGIARRAQLEAECLTVAQAASHLGRDPSRVRQRLAGPERTLLGWHRQAGGGEWLLPPFQFELGLHDTPEWARLVRALPHPDGTSPVALVHWLTEPQAHLGGRSRVRALAAEPHRIEQLAAEAASYAMAP